MDVQVKGLKSKLSHPSPSLVQLEPPPLEFVVGLQEFVVGGTETHQGEVGAEEVGYLGTHFMKRFENKQGMFKLNLKCVAVTRMWDQTEVESIEEKGVR